MNLSATGTPCHTPSYTAPKSPCPSFLPMLTCFAGSIVRCAPPTLERTLSELPALIALPCRCARRSFFARSLAIRASSCAICASRSSEVSEEAERRLLGVSCAPPADKR